MTGIESDDRTVGNAKIWRTAYALVAQHGKDAPTRAARCADALKDAGDTDGFRMWVRVMEVTEELLRKERAPGETVH